MTRTKFTYGQLDRTLRAMNLSRRFLADDPPAYVYEHRKYGPLFTIPPFPENDRVLDFHLALARTMLDNFGIAEPTVFDAELQKAG